MSKQDILYAVWGETGEYDDHVDWVVAVYKSEAEAVKHRDRAKTREGEFRKENAGEFCFSSEKFRAFMGELDPDGRIDDETQYTVGQVSLRSKAP